MTHICMPLRTAPVTRVPADPLDCPLCRRVFLEAFRAPAEAPQVTDLLVHLTDVEVFVRSAAVPSWRVTCSCGYRKYGTAQGEVNDVRMAGEAWAYRHRTDPEEADG